MLLLNNRHLLKMSWSSVVLATVLLSVGCDKTPSTDNETATDKPTEVTAVDTPVVQKDAVTPTDNANQNQDEIFVMTTLGLDSVNNMILAPLIAGDTLTPAQKTCLQARDKYLGQKELQAYYKGQFSTAELKELDDFYKSKVGQKMLEYGRQELAVMTGEKGANPMPDPTAEEIAEIKAFTQSPTGIKYAQVNNAIGEGSAIAALDAPLNAEFQRCDIDLTMAKLMQPPAAPAPAPAG